MGYIRFFLAIGVVVHHFPGVFAIMNGGTAVELFFIISGFYMALVHESKYASKYGVFLRNRLLRLLPTYYLAIGVQLVLLLGFGILHDLPAQSWIRHATASADMAAGVALLNAIPLGQELASFPNHPLATDGIPAWQFLLAPQSWSISLELAFYAIVPFLAKRVRLIMAIFAASFVLHWVLIEQQADYDTWVRRTFPSILHFFMLGMLSFYVSRHYKAFLSKCSVATPCIMLAVIALMCLVLRSPLDFAKSFGYPLLSVTFAFCLPFWFYRLRHPVEDYLGQLSYPIYMTHLIAISLVVDAMHLQGYKGLTATLVLTLTASALIYHYLEMPIDRLRQQLAKRSKPSAALGSAA